MIAKTLLAAAMLAAASTPALAQSDWNGFYFGGQVGQSDPSGSGGNIQFDTNLDGGFGDTVNTSGGANAFSPGFCGGAANTATPDGGCDSDDGGTEYGLRVGYDWGYDNFVFGVLGEYSQTDATDSVSAFSTTPARYTFTRELESTLALRARAGFAFGGDSEWLGYVTAGFVRGSIDNSFSSSNTANNFVLSDGDDADGYQAGLGLERRIGDSFSIGIEYLYTELDDDETRVRAERGTAGATNPFILTNPAGTDFRRSDKDFELDSLRLVATVRF